MRKYISLFEEYDESDMRGITSETSGGWTDVRNTIQQAKPFTIICFNDDDSYSRFIDSIDYDFIKHDYYHDKIGDSLPHMRLPAIFITKSKLEVFGSDDPFEEHDIFGMIYQKSENQIIAKFKHEKIDLGNELVSSLAEDEINSEDYLKVGSMFYKFINFLG